MKFFSKCMELNNSMLSEGPEIKNVTYILSFVNISFQFLDMCFIWNSHRCQEITMCHVAESFKG